MIKSNIRKANADAIWYHSGFLYLPHIVPPPDISYKIFVMIGAIWSSILYIFSLFEYYKVTDDRIIFVSRLGMKKKEAYFTNIYKIYVYPDKLIKAVHIEYGTLGGNEIVVNSGIKDYKKLIRIIIERSEGSPNRLIDKRAFEIIK